MVEKEKPEAPFRKKVSLEQAREAWNDLQELKRWREDARVHPELYLFYKFFEFSSFHKDRTNQENFDHYLYQFIANARFLSPRLRDFFFCLSAHLDGSSYIPEFDSNKTHFQSLLDSGDLEVLMNSNYRFFHKKNRMDQRLLKELLGKSTLDKLDRERASALEKETHESSMDEVANLEKGDDPEQVIALIAPHFGGYWKEQTFDLYQNGIWTHSDEQKRVVQDFDSREGTTTQRIHWRKFKPNQWNRLSLPPGGFVVSASKPEPGVYPKPPVHHAIDADGNTLFMPDSTGEVTFFIHTETASHYRRIPKYEVKQRIQSMPAEFTQETRLELERIKAKKLKNIDAARAFLAYTVRRLRYPNKKDFAEGSLDQLLKEHPNGKIGGIDRIKIADCDTAADYGAAGCSFLGIPVRLGVGHFIQNPDKNGFCSLKLSNRHAWLEVYNEDTLIWETIDFTPPGNPDYEIQENSVKRGAFTPAENAVLTDQQVEELEGQLRQRLLLTRSQEKAMDFAEETTISLEKAQQIIDELQKAEKLTMPNGERIIDVLMKLFMYINELNQKKLPHYSGPITRAEGGSTIMSNYLVKHRLGILAGQADPATRRLESVRVQEEIRLKGFDLFFVHNRSVSTNDRVEGVPIFKHQRLTAFLVDQALAQIQERINANRLSSTIQIRTQNTSFLSGKTVSVDKPLSSSFSDQDKVKLWDKLSKTGAGDADSVGLDYLLKQIKSELSITLKDTPEQVQAKIKADGKLRIIILTTDGEPDDATAVKATVSRLSQLNAIVLGIGITNHGLGTIEELYQNSNGSRGVLLKNPQELPELVARFIIERTLTMLPDNKQALITSFIKKHLPTTK